MQERIKSVIIEESFYFIMSGYKMDTIASDTCQQYRTLHFKNINIYNWRQDSGWHCCVHIKNELIDIFIKS